MIGLRCLEVSRSPEVRSRSEVEEIRSRKCIVGSRKFSVPYDEELMNNTGTLWDEKVVFTHQFPGEYIHENYIELCPLYGSIGSQISRSLNFLQAAGTLSRDVVLLYRLSSSSPRNGKLHTH